MAKNKEGGGGGGRAVSGGIGGVGWLDWSWAGLIKFALFCRWVFFCSFFFIFFY